MMMMNYLKIGALVALVVAGFWFKSVLTQNGKLRLENEAMILQVQETADNIKLLVQQLDREIEYRQIAEAALSQLSEVPDEVYTRELPPEIQSILDRFHERIGR